ncbi:MAG TPA: WSC domain-containing protein [Thermoanaerobaculia bacterium]|jgi:hypothetical protein|nr:WSC domain-containing protein [Thermoanaerobaculia bacterium]
MSIVRRIKKILPLLLLAIPLGAAGRLDAQTPVNAKVLSVGQGWRLLEVGEDVATVPGTMMWEVSEGGIKSLPVSQTQKDIINESFNNDPDGTDGLLFMSKEILEAMENPDFPAGYEQYIDPNEVPDPNNKSLFGCSWHDETRNRTWTYSKSLLNQNLPFSGGIDGHLNLDLPVSGSVTIAARYKIKKCLGVPSGFEFVDAVASGNATVAGTGDLTASASASANYSKEWLLTEPELGEIEFTIGIIPVRLVFTLPIFAGVDLNAKISGQLSAHLNASASGTFTYTCTTSHCSGTSNFTDNFSFTGPNASVTVDLSAQAHARVMLRVGIYDEHIAYLEGGLKAYARAGVWGYIGNTCGDADGDGTNETVRALAADLIWGYKFAYGYGGLLLPDSLNYTGGSEYPLGWQDLLGTGGSTALQPMLSGPATATQGAATDYTVKMRPCYPYTQSVNFSLAPGTWTGPTSVSPTGTATVQGTLATAGNNTLVATANSDSFGRNLQMPYSRVVNVTPVTPTAPALSAMVLSSTSVRLNWTDSNTYKTGYEVQRRVSGVGSFAWLTTVGSTLATFADNTAQPATAYDYKVRALNAGTASPYSNVVTVTTAATLPLAPSSLAATPQFATSVALSWADNSNNETNFEVQRRLLPSGVFGVIVTTAANVVSFIDSSATANTSYEYKVRSKNSAGFSAFSNVATATTGQTVPVAPSGLAATYNSTTRQFTLTWVDNSNNEQGFVAQFSYSGSAFSDLAPVGANITTFASGANPPVGSYQLKVRAYNAAGSSTYSNTVSLLVINPGNGPGYLGCYTDATTRALPVQMPGASNTIESCKAAAYNAGYKYAGLQYYGQCYAGNTLGYALVADSECNTACTGNPAQTCGGGWHNSIYSTGYNPPPAATSIAWIQPAENAWGAAGTLTAAGYATNGTGTVTLTFRERSSTGVWGAWITAPYSASVSPDTTWSNTISNGNPTNKCHWFDAYTTFSGATSPTFHYTGWTGCP